MEVRRGEIWWVSLPEPSRSEPGYQRPVLVVQADIFNRSRLSTVIVVALTTNLKRAEEPGNVALSTRATGLPSESVANVTQLLAIDQSRLVELAGRLTAKKMEQVAAGVRLVLGL